jgi:hypothetical protein
MRFLASALWPYGSLLAIIISGVCADADPNFMSVRKNVTKEYKSKTRIPTEKYFRK